MEPLARAAEAGIHCLPIPTPFAVGRVNTYLIEDDPLTLLDTGPNSGKALDELELALARHGRRIEDLGLVIVSHQHIDHEGLLPIVARRSGAEVAALDLLAPFLADFGPRMDADDEFAAALMRRHGIGEDMIVALRTVTRISRAWGAAGEVTLPLHDGEELRLRDRALRVHHRPGHSPSDTVLHDADARILLAADHLIKHVSSNPLIALPLDGSDVSVENRPRALVGYLESMRATRAMDDVELVLSGHGEPIADHVGLIDDRFAMHEKRAKRIHRVLTEQGPLSAHAIARALWGSVAIAQAFLTLSEVLGHVDLLLADGRALEVEGDDGVALFAPA
jgi:glyoxylase-like metal-dependent hydrolase (beta-lactamase superfamily II)